MKKVVAVFAAACLCACMVAALAGCSSGSTSKSSSASMDVKEKTVSTDPIYVLLIGNDSRYKTSEGEGLTEQGNTYGDTIMLMRVDPATNAIAICSVPRDTLITYNGQEAKINDVHYFSGPSGMANEVGKMFGVKVSYYFDMDFVQFADFINAIGGVSMNVPLDITGGDIIAGKDISLSAGEQTLSGDAALMLVRQRKLYAQDGEACRQVLSRQLVSSAIQAAASQPSSKADSFAEILTKACATDMSKETLSAYIAAFQNANANPIAFNLGTAPYSGGITDSGAWGITYDADTYAALAKAMEDGTDLNSIVAPPTLALG